MKRKQSGISPFVVTFECVSLHRGGETWNTSWCWLRLTSLFLKNPRTLTIFFMCCLEIWKCMISTETRSACFWVSRQCARSGASIGMICIEFKWNDFAPTPASSKHAWIVEGRRQQQQHTPSPPSPWDWSIEAAPSIGCTEGWPCSSLCITLFIFLDDENAPASFLLFLILVAILWRLGMRRHTMDVCYIAVLASTKPFFWIFIQISFRWLMGRGCGFRWYG